jgi:hypothetical protein
MPASSAATAPANCREGAIFTGTGRAVTFATALGATTGFDFAAGFCLEGLAAAFILLIGCDFALPEGDFDRAICLVFALADVGFFGI